MCAYFHKNRNQQKKITKVFVYEKTNPKPASCWRATPGIDAGLHETRLAGCPRPRNTEASALTWDTRLLGAALGPPFLRTLFPGEHAPPSRQELQMDFGPAQRTLSQSCARISGPGSEIRIFIEHPLAPSSLAWAQQPPGWGHSTSLSRSPMNTSLALMVSKLSGPRQIASPL